MLSQTFIIALWQGVVFGILAAIFSILITPLQVLKVIKQQTSNSYYRIIEDLLKSGWTSFFRGFIPYAVMNFFANFSFGVGNYITGRLLHEEYNIVSKIFVSIILGGGIETVFTIYPEIKQIVESKGNLIKAQVKMLPLLLPLLCRNSLAWIGPVCAYEFANLYRISSFSAVVLSFLLGLLSAAISVPFDVLTTRLCGTELSKPGQIFATLKEEKFFSGLVIRLIQNALFAMLTFVTMIIFYPLAVSLKT